MDLDEYSGRAERFGSELAWEYYRRFSGQQAELDLTAIYERHATLFTTAAVARLREAHARESDADVVRRLRALLRFAVDGHLAARAAAPETQLSRTEAVLELQLLDPAAPGTGAALAYRDAGRALAAEPDAERRAAIDEARNRALTRTLAPLAREVLALRRSAVEELGWPCYRTMCEDVDGVDLGALGEQADAFLAATESAFGPTVQPAVRATLGLDLADLRRCDLPRFFRQPQTDRHFPAEGLEAIWDRTVTGLAVDGELRRRIHVDAEPRPGKSPRAFCAAVGAPDRVYLVVAPTGGRADYTALLHEAGHALHLAGADGRLPFELRQLGDPAIGEAFAFLLEGLLQHPAWLRRNLDAGQETEELIAQGRAARMVLLRRHAAKLCFELELHGPQAEGQDGRLAELYARRLSAAVQVPWPAQAWATDLDPGLYVASYLRAWALESRLRAVLTERFGPSWFAEPAAGAQLATLWREGQRLRAEELLERLGEDGAALDFAALADELGSFSSVPARSP